MENYFSAWQLLSRELISSDPQHIPVTFKVKEKKENIFTNIVIHTTYNIEQTALNA